jgi:EmrB/QacA subfamily drug resistance transporter
VSTNASSSDASAGSFGGAATRTGVNPNAVLGIVAIAQFMIVLDATIVNVALPTIERDLGFSQRNLLWVVNAYTLVFGGFLLLGGRLADQLGRRRLFMTGTALFSGASLVCGLSQSDAMLLAARGVQGLGGALVSPAALSIVLTTFDEGTARNRALAVWGAIAGAGGAVGLILGGVLVETLSWRWVFLVNVPVGALLLAISRRRIPESRSSGTAAGYDVGGAVAITLGTTSLVYVLIKADTWGWGTARTLGGLGISALLITAFVAIERRHSNPLVPLRIFSNRSLSTGGATLMLIAASLVGVIFFCTLYLQQVLGYSALQTGLAFLPTSVVIIASSAAASQIADRYSPKPVLVSGLLVSTVGLLLLTRMSGDDDYASHVLPALVVLGIGLGLSFVPATIAGTNGVAPQDSGLASGLLNTMQQVGGALGLAVLSSVANPRITDALQSGSPLPDALTHGFKGAFVVAASLCALGAVVALIGLPGRVRKTTDRESELTAFSCFPCPTPSQGTHLARLASADRGIEQPGEDGA